MKARIKATGEIVEVRYSHHSIDYPSLHYYKSQDGSTYKEESLDFDDTTDYWTRLEHQYTGQIAQSLVMRDLTIHELVDISQKIAHALVEKAKEKEERK